MPTKLWHNKDSAQFGNPLVDMHQTTETRSPTIDFGYGNIIARSIGVDESDFIISLVNPADFLSDCLPDLDGCHSEGVISFCYCFLYLT